MVGAGGAMEYPTPTMGLPLLHASGPRMGMSNSFTEFAVELYPVVVLLTHRVGVLGWDVDSWNLES